MEQEQSAAAVPGTMVLPTVKVRLKDDEGTEAVINREDFNALEHELVEDETPVLRKRPVAAAVASPVAKKVTPATK